MKKPRLLPALLAVSLLATAACGADPKPAAEKGAKAHAQEKAKGPEWAELFGDASLPLVWQSASAAATKIEGAIQANRFEGVPDWAETIHLAAHALEDQVTLGDAGQQKRLKGALEQAARLADAVLDAGQHEEAKKLADSFGRLNAALKLAAARLPKEITSAPPQEPRFAKAAGHAHDAHGGHK